MCLHLHASLQVISCIYVVSDYLDGNPNHLGRTQNIHLRVYFLFSFSPRAILFMFLNVSSISEVVLRPGGLPFDK